MGLSGSLSNPDPPLLRLLRLNRDDEVAVALAVGRPMIAICGVAKQQQRRLTKPQQAELVERYRSGDLMTELARRFEIDRRTVSAILKRHDVPTRPQGLSVEQVRDAV